MPEDELCPVGYVILKDGYIITTHFETGFLFGRKLTFTVTSEPVYKWDYDEAEVIQPGEERK